MEQQLQLFDPKDYLGVDGYYYTEIDLDDEQYARVKKAAEQDGITIEEYASKAIKFFINSLTCNTCKQYREGVDVMCKNCGEVE